MGMEAKDHALYGGLYNKGHKISASKRGVEQNNIVHNDESSSEDDN